MAANDSPEIRVAVAGVGNCASSLVEGTCYYRQHPDTDAGLLFPSLAGYTVRDIGIVAAFDISRSKVGLPVREAIYQPPNNFCRIRDVSVDVSTPVLRGPTLDGNPEHLARLVNESPVEPVDVSSVLRQVHADVLLNLLPTGSIRATEFYAEAALRAGCAFVNCIPTPLAQKGEMQARYAEARLPLFGDDIKSQMGTTILHRSLLALLEMRGARLTRTSQINIGGNTDFANFVHRAETKLISKRKSLARYVGSAEFHVGHHYDLTRGALKTALIEIEARVFGGSPVRISVNLENDDKPNSAGSVVDLIRLSQGARKKNLGGPVPEVCAFYMKSPPTEMEDGKALELVVRNWT
jgi:myo-inositol-1-phosphate synthase